MESKDGPAFPEQVKVHTKGIIEIQYIPGMTVGDYFAGQALVGLTTKYGIRFRPKEDADYCFDVSNAMLERRNK